MKKIAAILLLAAFVAGCIQAPVPTATPAPTTIQSATPTPTARATNFSNEIQALGSAMEPIKLVQGEWIGSFDEIERVRDSLSAYSEHLQSLDPAAPETIFLRKNVEVAERFLDSNEYYLGAINTGARSSANFTCADLKVYNLALNLTTSSVELGREGVAELHSLANDYPSLAGQVNSRLAADLIGAFYDGMQDYVDNATSFIKVTCS